MGLRAAKNCCVTVMIGLLLLVNLAGQNTSPSFLIVAHPETPVDKINRWDLSAIFLGKKTIWDGEEKVYPCMLREDQMEMREFIAAIHFKTVGQYRAYWKKRLFSGGGTVPKTFKRTKSLVDYVADRQGAIGVIPAQRVTAGVKVVELEW